MKMDSNYLQKILFLTSAFFCHTFSVPSKGKFRLRVATVNIWNGGIHSQDGLWKFAKHIYLLNPDIVALQEVYGNGAEKLADILNKFEEEMNFGKNGRAKQKWTATSRQCDLYTDTALISRHKFVELADEGCNLWGNGAKIELTNGINGEKIRINVFGMHLDYVNYGPEMAMNSKLTEMDLIQMEQVRVKNILQLFANPKFMDWNLSSTFSSFYDKSSSTGEPLIIMGDFNTPSHLDWTVERIAIHGGRTIQWPTTKLLTDSGFTDSFRSVHPKAWKEPGNTWPYKSTSPGSDADRIDFIFAKGKQLKAIQAFIYPNPNDESLEWPSDHYALIVDYILFRQKY